MTVLSLFDGISCGRLALERAEIDVDEYYAAEVDKYAEAVSSYNWQLIRRLGDVKNWDSWQLPKIDLLIGGSPCQDLSIAKKERQGLAGSRSNLFYCYVECLKKFKPQYFLYENVASMPKEAKAIISKELGVEPILINSALVSAQQRKRLYWTNIPISGVLEDKKILLNDILESGVSLAKSHALVATYSHASPRDLLKNKRTQVFEPVRIGELNGSKGQGNRIYSVQGKSVTLSANGGGLGAKIGLYKIDLPDGDYTIRKLAPIECERLQTIPDNYTRHGDFDGEIKQISDTQRYKMLGNGWTVDVIGHLLSGLKRKVSDKADLFQSYLDMESKFYPKSWG